MHLDINLACISRPSLPKLDIGVPTLTGSTNVSIADQIKKTNNTLLGYRDIDVRIVRGKNGKEYHLSSSEVKWLTRITSYEINR